MRDTVEYEIVKILIMKSTFCIHSWISKDYFREYVLYMFHDMTNDEKFTFMMAEFLPKPASTFGRDPVLFITL